MNPSEILSSLIGRPEEKIRQRFIEKMVGELGYPRALLAVEKDLASLAFLSAAMDPNRRLDILALTPGGEGLKPLLLVECKAKEIDEAALSQVLGYNRALGAPFVCLTNGTITKTFWKEIDSEHAMNLVSIPFLPSYRQLLEKL
jgi:hypothetical protein